MDRVKQDSENKPSFGKVMRRMAFVFLVVVALAAGTVGGVFGRYVFTSNTTETSQVADVGIEVFELKEHAVLPSSKLTPKELRELADANCLHKLDLDKEINGASAAYVVPLGADVPKDTFVRLTIQSEVSYQLFLKVTVRFNVDENAAADSGLNFDDLVTYSLTNSWEYDTQEGAYRYVVNASGTNRYVFGAGTRYAFDGDKVIKIFKDDKLHVGENYYSHGAYTSDILTFTIDVEAYIRQVI